MLFTSTLKISIPLLCTLSAAAHVSWYRHYPSSITSKRRFVHLCDLLHLLIIYSPFATIATGKFLVPMIRIPFLDLIRCLNNYNCWLMSFFSYRRSSGLMFHEYHCIPRSWKAIFKKLKAQDCEVQVKSLEGSRLTNNTSLSTLRASYNKNYHPSPSSLGWFLILFTITYTVWIKLKDASVLFMKYVSNYLYNELECSW